MRLSLDFPKGSVFSHKGPVSSTMFCLILEWLCLPQFIGAQVCRTMLLFISSAVPCEESFPRDWLAGSVVMRLLAKIGLRKIRLLLANLQSLVDWATTVQDRWGVGGSASVRRAARIPFAVRELWRRASASSCELLRSKFKKQANILLVAECKRRQSVIIGHRVEQGRSLFSRKENVCSHVFYGGTIL